MSRAGLHRSRWIAAALLAVVGVAQADWRRDYQFAQQAIAKGDWSEAEKLMRSAHAEEPAAAARKRFQGMQFELYAPAHYAAYAAYKQGACGRALDYLKDASNQAVTTQVANLAAEELDIQRACGGGQVAAAASNPPAVKPPIVTTEPPRPPPTTPAHPVVVAPTPEPPTAAPPVAALSERKAAPAALRAGLGAFLAGDYEAALRVNDAAIADSRGRALLLLVRAAAGFTRAEIKGGDAAMVKRAETDVRNSHRLARIDPDPTLFSPKMRVLIARVR